MASGASVSNTGYGGNASPDSELVRAQIARIVNHPEFSASEKRSEFLEYIVEETLAGREARIKGDAIAISVFGRGDDFDARTDPIVRLEARRLRRDLEHYYHVAGQDDPIIVTIPKGSYVPHFEERPATSPIPRAEANPEGVESRGGSGRNVLVAALALLVVGLIAVLGFQVWQGAGSKSEAKPWGDLPVIAVLPFEVLDETSSARWAGSGLSQDIITDLSRAAGLRVIASSSSSTLSPEAEEIADLAQGLGVTHVLRGNLQLAGDEYRLNVNLVEVDSGMQVWANRFDYSPQQRLKSQTDIARQVSGALSANLLPGQLNSIERGRWSSKEAQNLYVQAMTVIYPPSDPSRVVAAKQMLEQAIRLEPDAAQGYGGLALVQSKELWYGHKPVTPENRAIVEETAAKALAIDPGEIRALVALGLTAMVNGENDKAVAFLGQAAKEQPSSSYANAYLGITLIFNQQPEDAIRPIETALQLDPANSRRPYLNILAVARYHSGDFKGAVAAFEEVVQRQGPYGPAMMAYHAASYAALGDEGGEARVLAKLAPIVQASGSFSVENWLNLATADSTYVAPIIAELDEAKKLQ